MNLLTNLNKENEEKKKKSETAQLDDSDCSDTWSLPNWTELQQARLYRDKKIARLKRLRRREERQKLRDQKNAELEVVAVGSSGSLATLEEEAEDDLPEDMKQRGQWNNSCEFLLSIIAMSVGMGNFYRFPFVAYQNGGGAFLIPYILVLSFVGRPIYLLELAIGQFCSFGQVKVWDMAPIFRGVGYGSAIGSFCVVSYYSAVMGTTFYYLFQSFYPTLPWTVCDPEWAGKEVCDKIINITSTNKSIDPRQIVNLPALYFENKIMEEKKTIEDGIGIPLPMPTLCLFLSWALIYVMIAKGVESSGKAAYFTTFYPFTIIFIILIAACTKEGSKDGIMYFITPQWSKMTDPSVWFAAVGQCFFSLSAGFGPITNYASYNPFHHNIYRDAMVVSFMDTSASMIAGMTVFATLGSIAHTLKKPISEVIDGGPGLIFIAFSDAIADFAYVPQLLAVLFFTMLLTLAAGSAVAWQMAAISVICDKFPKLSRFWVTLSMSVAGFLVSLIYVTPGGQFMQTLVDNFGGNVNIYILATLECIGIAWAYGINNIVADIEFMLNKKVSWFWRMCWFFIIPVLLTVVMIYSLITGQRLRHNGVPYPDSAIVFGWMLTAFSVLCVPGFAVYEMYIRPGTWKERLLLALKPNEEYGPRNPSDRERWKLFKRGILANGGAGPDTYKLPDGETPSNNNLPDWLTVLEDGTVLPKKDVERHMLELAAVHKRNKRKKRDSVSVSVDVDNNPSVNGEQTEPYVLPPPPRQLP